MSAKRNFSGTANGHGSARKEVEVEDDDYEAPSDNMSSLTQTMSTRIRSVMKLGEEEKNRKGEGVDRDIKSPAVEVGDAEAQEMEEPPRWKALLFGIILPYNKAYVLWSDILLLFALYSCLVTPFEFAFYYGQPHFHLWLTILDTICSVYFMLDIFVNFRLAYKDKVRSIMVVDRGTIARKYIKSYFILDVMACAPWDLLHRYTGGSIVFSSLLWFRLVRMRHVKGWFKRMERDTRFDFYLVRVTEMLIAEYIVLHVAACIFYFLAVTYPEDQQGNTWIGSLKLGTKSYADYKTYPIMENYCVSLYWAMTTMATLGYGDIHPVNPREMIFVVFYLTWDMVFTVYLVANFAALVVRGNNKGSPAFRERLADMVRYCKRSRLPGKVRAQLINQVVLRYEHQHEDDEMLLQIFPQSIRDAVAMAKYGAVIKQAYLFRGCSPAFMDKLVTLFHTEYFMPDENVVTPQDMENNLYLVIKGRVEIRMKTEGVEFSEARLPGELFGESDVLMQDMGTSAAQFLQSYKVAYTARTMILCDLLRLEREPLGRLMLAYPEDTKRITANFVRNAPPSTDSSSDSQSGFQSSASASSSFRGRPSSLPRADSSYSSVVSDRVSSHWEAQHAHLGIEIINVAAQGDVERMKGLLEQAGSRWEATAAGRTGVEESGLGDNGGSGLWTLSEQDLLGHVGGEGEEGKEEKATSPRSWKTFLYEKTCGTGNTPDDDNLSNSYTGGKTAVERLGGGAGGGGKEILFLGGSGNSGRDAGFLHALAEIPLIGSPVSSHASLPRNFSEPLSHRSGSGSTPPPVPFIRTILDFNGRSPLHLAASRGFTEMCGFLLQEGSDVNLKDSNGATPLLDALRDGHTSTATFLQSHGAKVLLDNPAAEICEAVVKGRLEFVERLLMFGVNPNTRDSMGRTPLHVAAAEGSAALVRLLLLHGSDPLAADTHGALPLDEAAYSGCHAAYGVLEEWMEKARAKKE